MSRERIPKNPTITELFKVAVRVKTNLAREGIGIRVTVETYPMSQTKKVKP